MRTDEFFDLDQRIVRFRMKALQIGLGDNIKAYILAFN